MKRNFKEGSVDTWANEYQNRMNAGRIAQSRKTMNIANRTPPEPKMKSPGEYRISMPRLVRPEKLNALKDEIALLQATIEMNNITMARMRKERDAMINKKMEFGRYVMERTSWTNVQEGDYVFYRFTLKPSDDLDPVWRKVER